MDYDIYKAAFRVLKRVEVPRAEYSYDKAIQTIVELNEIYDPSYIYCDRGSGEYQIEQLHIIGDKNPKTGLKHKVKGFAFNQSLDIDDTVTHETTKQQLKEFMVNQLQMVIERDKLILSPFDEILYKQLIDYEVLKTNANGSHTYISKNEHFVDALGLSYLAFALEFPLISDGVRRYEETTKVEIVNKKLTGNKASDFVEEIEAKCEQKDDDSFKIINNKIYCSSAGFRKNNSNSSSRSSWGSRSSRRNSGVRRTGWGRS